MLGGEPDGAVHLMGVTEDAPHGVVAVRLGRGDFELCGLVKVERPGGPVRKVATRVDVGSHVDASVGDGLKRSDRPSELSAVLCVLHGELHRP